MADVTDVRCPTCGKKLAEKSELCVVIKYKDFTWSVPSDTPISVKCPRCDFNGHINGRPLA